jgi:WD40 repeat protein
MQQLADVERLFFEALGAPHEQQARFLERACGRDPALFRRVSSLLAAHRRLGSYLESAPPVLDGEELVAGLAALVEETRRGAKDQTGAELAPIPRAVAQWLGPPRRPGDAGSLGPYEIERLISSGGMGMVFLARDSRLDRRVALKAMHPALAADPTSRQRFVREARAIAALKHEHIVAIYDIEEAAAFPYLVMEFVEGGSLRARRDRTPAAVEIARIGSETAQALAAAHALGIVHRDVKPGNILLESPRQRVKLTDFGLARPMTGAHLTDSGLIAGTPHFMSPEQAQGLSVDARSDLFSLGSVLYTLAAGKPPFEAETSVAVLRRVIDDTPPGLAGLRPDLPAGLVKVIDDLMAKDPARRPASAAEVAELLGRLALDPSTELPARHRGAPRGRTWAAAAVLTGLAAFGIGAGARGVWLALNGSESPEIAPIAEVAPDEAPPVAEIPVESSVPAPSLSELFDENGQLAIGQRITTIDVSAGGTMLAVGRGDHVIEVRGGKYTREPLLLEGLTRPVASVAFSPDGERLATVSADRLMAVWDLDSGQMATKVVPSAILWQVAFLPGGERLIVMPYQTPELAQLAQDETGVRFGTDCLTILDAHTLQQVQAVRPREPHVLSTFACAPQGGWIALGTDTGKILLFDERGMPAGELTCPPLPAFMKRAMRPGERCPILSLLFTSDGQRLWSCRNDNLVMCHDLATGELRYQRRFPHGIYHLSLSSDESWLALGGATIDVRLVDLKGQLGQDGIVNLSGHQAAITFVRILPGDEQLVSASRQDGVVRLWKLPVRPAPKSRPP